MKEQIARHENVEYTDKLPFRFIKIIGRSADLNLLLNHWHEDLEFAYCFKGNYRHYINGHEYISQPGRIITTNSGYIHNIIPAPNMEEEGGVVSFVIMIDPKFIETTFPQYAKYYFTNTAMTVSPELESIILQLYSICDTKEKDEFWDLKIKSLVLEFLYNMCRQGMELRTEVDNINYLKDIERIKGVLQYIEDNYTEKLPQADVAKKFYFGTEYFSRYFKRCLGMTYTEYLTTYRVEKARKELESTSKSISQIAMETGFSDDRRLIIAFKDKYGTTPLQYRKKCVKA